MPMLVGHSGGEVTDGLRTALGIACVAELAAVSAEAVAQRLLLQSEIQRSFPMTYSELFQNLAHTRGTDASTRPIPTTHG